MKLLMVTLPRLAQNCSKIGHVLSYLQNLQYIPKLEKTLVAMLLTFTSAFLNLEYPYAVLSKFLFIYVIRHSDKSEVTATEINNSLSLKLCSKIYTLTFYNIITVPLQNLLWIFFFPFSYVHFYYIYLGRCTLF